MINIKSLLKTISWRCIATVDTFVIAWFITGKLDWAATIAGLEIMTKTILYYAHERGWSKILKKCNLGKASLRG